MCIKTKGSIKKQMSPYHIMKNSLKGMSCKTCNSINAWQNILSVGITTNECCPFISDSVMFPSCVKSDKCILPHILNEKFVISSAKTIKKNRHAAMIEIETNGPIQSDMELYEDLLQYKKDSIYSYKYGNFLGIISVKVNKLNYFFKFRL